MVRTAAKTESTTTHNTPCSHLDGHLFASLGVDRELDLAERAFPYGLTDLVLSHLKTIFWSDVPVSTNENHDSNFEQACSSLVLNKGTFGKLSFANAVQLQDWRPCTRRNELWNGSTGHKAAVVL